MNRAGIFVAEPHGDAHPGNEATGQAYFGREARAAILEHLVGHGRPRALAQRVCDFYGDTLRFHASPALPSSFYEISLQHNPVGLRYVLVKHQLGTNRTAESLSHEILHIGLSLRGYPVPERVFVPHELLPSARHLMGMQSAVHNLIEHELIFDDFRCLGFRESTFVSDLTAPPNYEGIAAISPVFGEAVGFPWWSLEYFRYWLSARLGLGSVASSYADSALRWGSRVYPALKESTRQMSRLVESGMLRDSRLYRDCVNRLLGLMKLPAYTGWVIIKPGEDGRPAALKWDRESLV